MSPKYYIRTLIAIISVCCFSACTTPFKLRMDVITRQNRAKVIRLFSYDNFAAVLQDSTLLISGRRKEGAPIIKHLFKEYKCIAEDPIVEDSYIIQFTQTYTVNGVRMEDDIPMHYLILSCNDGKKFEVTFIVEGNRWLIFDMDVYPRPRYVD